MTQLKGHLRYLNQLQRFEEIKPGLAVMRTLLNELGNPHEQFSSIHIAGTNGKGSVAAMLTSMLQHSPAPRRLGSNRLLPAPSHHHPHIGRYTSPHLERFNERVSINNQPISEGELNRLIADVRAAAQRTRLSPTFFEFTTAVAFLYFAREQVDLAVIEVGMGGRLDATNVITPLASIITNIGLDHTQWLGVNRRAIAQEKAGIIKPNVPLITAERDPAILAILASLCRQRRAPFYPVHRHLRARRLQRNLSEQTFAVTGAVKGTFALPLLGRHQIDNALTALLTAITLSRFPATAAAIQPAFSAVRWPGRLQIVTRDPFILLDGAHNPPAANALARFLDDEPLLPSPDVLVLGSKNDKDVSALLKHIVPRFRRVIISQATYQPMPAEVLANYIQTASAGLPATRLRSSKSKASPQRSEGWVTAEPSLPRALTQARRELCPGSMLLITGSLYLVGDALAHLAPARAFPINKISS